MSGRPSRSFAGLPPHGEGQRIGLFGGSFNPPHEGHRAASLMALRRLRLDAVWWLVTPGNPLKDHSDLPPIAERMAAAAAVAAHPRIIVTAVERRLGTAYSAEVVAALRRRSPTARFVFLMGADSLGELQRWRRWRRLAEGVPLAVIDRPGSTLRAGHGAAAASLAAARLPERDAARLADAAPPAWVFLHGPRSTLSSTAIRAARG